jgi:hypothetical protein
MVLLLLNHGSNTTLEGANGTAKQVALTAKQLGIYQVHAITTIWMRQRCRGGSRTPWVAPQTRRSWAGTRRVRR